MRRNRVSLHLLLGPYQAHHGLALTVDGMFQVERVPFVSWQGAASRKGKFRSSPGSTVVQSLAAPCAVVRRNFLQSHLRD